MDRSEPYKVRDLPQDKGPSWGGEAQIPLSCLWWIRLNGSSYHRVRSLFPQTVSPSILVFLIPTRSSSPSTSIVVSLNISYWTYSLQIHCNGSAWPRSHLSLGPSLAWKTWTLQLAPSMGRAARAMVSTMVCLGRVKPPSARVSVGRLWWPVYYTIQGELSDGLQFNGPLTSCTWPVPPLGVRPPQT